MPEKITEHITKFEDVPVYFAEEAPAHMIDVDVDDLPAWIVSADGTMEFRAPPKE